MSLWIILGLLMAGGVAMSGLAETDLEEDAETLRDEEEPEERMATEFGPHEWGFPPIVPAESNGYTPPDVYFVDPTSEDLRSLTDFLEEAEPTLLTEAEFAADGTDQDAWQETGIGNGAGEWRTIIYNRTEWEAFWLSKASDDTLTGSGASEGFMTALGDDVVRAGHGDDEIQMFHGGSDTVFGGAGDDVIANAPSWGGFRVPEFDGFTDQIDAGSGDDLLLGDINGHRLTLGAGADMILANASAEVTNGPNIITDFDPAQGDEIIIEFHSGDISENDPIILEETDQGVIIRVQGEAFFLLEGASLQAVMDSLNLGDADAPIRGIIAPLGVPRGP